jgi:octaprenyl-diphosphate synthase
MNLMQTEGMMEDDLLIQMIDEVTASTIALLTEASEHIIRSGGKRTRPKIALFAYEAVGGTVPAETIPAAAAIELIHTASLVHDDINDRSNLRRGQVTINARWGNAAALLTGDFLFCKAMKLVARQDPRIIEILADTCIRIVEGETRQLLSLENLEIDEETYLEIVRQKTASLFAASAEIGGLLAGASEDQVRALAEYGLNLGVAFQIRDDMLDFLGRPEELGKPIGTDLRQRKMSLALVDALQRAGGRADQALFRDVSSVVQFLRETGSLEYARDKSCVYADRAKEALSILPNSPARMRLFELANFAAERNR